MKVKSLANEVSYSTVPAGEVFTLEGYTYINLKYTVFGDGDKGVRYNAVDLIDGEPVYIGDNELVLYYPNALVSLQRA